jgi:hypothetical protein
MMKSFLRRPLRPNTRYRRIFLGIVDVVVFMTNTLDLGNRFWVRAKMKNLEEVDEFLWLGDNSGKAFSYSGDRSMEQMKDMRKKPVGL